MNSINKFQISKTRTIAALLAIIIIVIVGARIVFHSGRQIDLFSKNVYKNLNNNHFQPYQALRILFDSDQITSQKVESSTTYSKQISNLIIREVFNQKNKGKVFAKSDQFYIKVDPPKTQTFANQLKQLSIFYNIQVGSPYDYTNILQAVNFKQLSKQLSQSISYQLIYFPHNDSLDKQQSFLQINNTNKSFQYVPKDDDIVSYMQLAQYLIREPNNIKYRQMQYNFYNKKYKIGNIKQQLPICVFSSGYKTFSKNRYAQFFKSLQRQNYTNFHIIYVDDNSPLGNIQGIIKFMEQNKMRIKNKIKIVHNLQHLGALANMYFWINKYCQQQDIVINIDSDDGLIGTQVFQVLNSIYQNSQIWFAYTRYILTQNNHSSLSDGFSQRLQVKASQYRNAIYLWSVSHMRTFRKKLFAKIPLQMFIEYHMDQTTNIAYPVFYNSAADTFQIFTLLEMAGDNKIIFIDQFLYLYFGINSNENNQNCYLQHQKFDDYKSRIKIPMNQLVSLNQQASQIQNYMPSQNTFGFFKYIHNSYVSCLNK